MKRARDMDIPPVPPSATPRASERAREVLLVSYTIDPDLAAEYTETYDIAIGGMAMLTNAELTRDQTLIIELELRGNPRPKLRLNGNVRWSTFDPLLGKFRTGVSFVDRPAEFERELLHYIDTLHNLRDLGAI